MNDNLSNRVDIAQPLSLLKDSVLDDNTWQLAGVPLGDGNFWMYRDTNAKIAGLDGGIEIDIPRFSASHDQVQIFDNPKQLYLTRAEYSPGPKGIIAFSCEMQAEVRNADLTDYRDGFCAFNVLDFSSGMVFDIVSNGSKLWVVYERLFMPGITTQEQAFTRFEPIAMATSSHESLKCAIAYDRNSDCADYYINDGLVYRAQSVPVKIDNLQTGFGIITLHSIVNGKSVSCKGQGGRGFWRGFNVYMT